MVVIATLDEVKTWIGIPLSNTDHDDNLTLIMNSTTKAIYNYVDTPFELTPITNEVKDGIRADILVPKFFPTASVQEIRFGIGTDGTGGTVVDPTEYIVAPDSITFRWLHTPFYRGSVGLDYTYGYDGVPDDVKLAFIQAVEAQFRRKGRKSIGMASRSKKDESEAYSGDLNAWDGLTGLPKEIVAMLKPYKSFEFPTDNAQRNL